MYHNVFEKDWFSEFDGLINSSSRLTLNMTSTFVINHFNNLIVFCVSVKITLTSAIGWGGGGNEWADGGGGNGGRNTFGAKTTAMLFASMRLPFVFETICKNFKNVNKLQVSLLFNIWDNKLVIPSFNIAFIVASLLLEFSALENKCNNGLYVRLGNIGAGVSRKYFFNKALIIWGILSVESAFPFEFWCHVKIDLVVFDVTPWFSNWRNNEPNTSASALIRNKPSVVRSFCNNW